MAISIMPPLTTIDEALSTLPSSSSSSTSSLSGNILPKPRLLLKKGSIPKKSTSSWVPSNPSHILAHGLQGKRVKETILINGRDEGVKQLVKINSRLPMPFLEQNGPEEDNNMNDVEEEMGMTASDLEMDTDTQGGMTLEDLESPSPPSKSSKGTTSPVAKRRRITKDKDEEDYESLPSDFLKLLKEEVPGGKKDVSPGDFARVWKMSGRGMGNELVLAQNEYFKAETGKDIKRKGRRGK